MSEDGELTTTRSQPVMDCYRFGKIRRLPGTDCPKERQPVTDCHGFMGFYGFISW